jgi:hypothetical protein
MSAKKYKHHWTKLLRIVGFSNKNRSHKGLKPLNDEIKNRIALKIERAEIMAAMIAMREGK